MGTLPYLLLVVLSSLSLVPRAAAYSEYSCNGTTGNFTAASAFGANLARLVAALPANASSSPSLFASAAVGAAPDTAYGLALCRGDVTDAGVCSACLADAFGRLRRLCGADRDATFYADLCTARYSGGDFLARPDDNSPVINALDVNGSTYYGWDARNATSRTLFLSLVGTLFGEMAMYAAYNSSAARMFASAAMYVNPQLPTVYGFVQCTPDLSRAQCWDCFQVLQDQNRRWYDGREGGRILGVRCSFRYEAYHFFGGMPEVRIGLKGDPSSPAAETEIHGSNHRVVLIVAVIVSITAFSAMMAAGLVIIRARRRKGAEKKRKLQLEAQSRNSSTTEDALKLWRIEESSSEFTLYDFAELAAATGGFSDENLLGRGGFGPVYKGKLPDGAEIAVKRLAAHSGQGLEEFKNEIQLIAKLQHTNLVRLVGCCVQEEEKLLVYEYMPNRSLNCFIFDQQRGPLLDWEKRRRIIEGVAQGLLYLHKHSRVRIIHRDLKASNILLDKDLNPKISDFGMARIFGSNMTEANTNRVVGTYGYMAPEYASEGIFSVKSDVYSFGVLLLEIVSGKRNTGHHNYGDFVNLLGYAWQLWRDGRVFELIDPTLGERGDVATIVRCVKVALLCVQESATDRPTMADVTAMLATAGDAASAGPLPDPKRPPHFSLRVATTSGSDDDCGSRTRFTTSCSTNDLTITSIHEGR
ncbi:cysteine-rich receptor-like protein kinase 19 [Zea mays]|uniref:non-specific serine/threonine protein kinase n=3 Tax=Zea mays TaxID=4577 RepID=A0A1D6IDY1_MAIZE|nr:cysteine-rich receptor-like protein kinase 19 [Zea mays]ONM57999.1 Cysteine-rich receptor-like protein kinase 25 [Zea mays]|eukprot:XP_008653175.1 cysteine-rich receptor-like protein kinase 19 [Zea mays]